jgi:hypothetical protein
VPFTPEGVEPPVWWALAVAPDGSRVVARAPDGTLGLWPLEGGAPQALAALPAEAVPVEWAPDGKELIIGRRLLSGWAVGRFDLTTGRFQGIRDIVANEAAGLRISLLSVTPDGKYMLHSYSRLLVDVYVAKGLE